ncbi:FAD-dependent monooxygenase NtnA [Paramyrothecium foliicola]|nr:FAD-dependent monooxygenase NtnA [Paramyrothecium foliicola]
MASQFKVLIIGGGVAGLALAIMLEAYGFDYELLEKHADVAPKLGAGVGLTPNGGRILDQIGVLDSMRKHASPVDSGTALSPDGETVIYNPHMGEWLEKLFGYKIHFLSRHDCLRILHEKIQHKSRIHTLREVIKIEPGRPGEKTLVETKDGSVYSGDLVIGADGVRSSVRRELWRLADTEQPGYIPKRDKEAIVSFYTAVIGIAHNPGLPKGGSARAYNDQRSYFFQEGREGSGEFYWWLCVKNPKIEKGIIPKLSPDLKQELVEKYANDKIGQNLTLGELHKKSVYSTIIPLQEFVLEKCFYKSIVLVGDAFRKPHPVAGQGANSAVEESAFVADILYDLREQGALNDPTSVQKAFTEYQTERTLRMTALRDDAHLVQQMESLDNPIMKFVALKFVPKLNFVLTFLPQLGSSFTPARHLKHLPPPKAGLCPFTLDMKAKPRPRSTAASLSWISIFALAAFSPWIATKYLDIEGDNSVATESSSVFQLYLFTLATAISGFWVVESYKASSIMSPFVSALVWIFASNSWGWENTLPIYLAIHLLLSQSAIHYHMPQTMTDFGAAKALLPAFALTYGALAFYTIVGYSGTPLDSWPTIHYGFPVAVYLQSLLIQAISTLPQSVDAVFSNLDISYQRVFWHAVVFLSGAAHVALGWNYGASLLDEGLNLLANPVARSFASLATVAVSWSLYAAWEIRRIKATDTPVGLAWVAILVSTILAGPAATFAGSFSWYKDQLAKATSFQNAATSTEPKRHKRYRSDITRHVEI